MVSTRYITAYLLIGITSLLVQAAAGFKFPFHQDSSVLVSQAKDVINDNLQSFDASWAAGVVDSFKLHGTTLLKVAQESYAQLPSDLRDQAEKAHAQVYETEWKDLPEDIQNYIKEHPYQTTFYIVNGVVFFAPSAASGPVLWFLGYTSVGPRAASFASMLQSKLGIVSAKSLFAYAQSAQMGGYGVPVINAVTRLGAALGGVGNTIWGSTKPYAGDGEENSGSSSSKL